MTDASGAVVGGAKVTLTNEGTNAKLTTTAGPDGTYKFTPVRIGTYTDSVLSRVPDDHPAQYHGQCGLRTWWSTSRSSLAR